MDPLLVVDNLLQKIKEWNLPLCSNTNHSNPVCIICIDKAC